MSRVAVAKTYKLFIGGKFVRSESGRSERRVDAKEKFIANCTLASRKDLRDAVKAAREAFEPWRSRTGYNRGQIIYRMAEMLESRSDDFVSLIQSESGLSKAEANKEVQIAADRLVYYAGWADKFTSVHGSVNPVAGDYFDFSFPEPMGVVVVFAPESSPLVAAVSQIASVVVTGGTCVFASSEKCPLTQLLFAEVVATSDVPAGVVNILAGERKAFLKSAASHMDVNAIDYCDGDPDTERLLVVESCSNVKRLRLGKKMTRAQWLSDKTQGIESIEKFVETKTVWHPVGL